MGHDQLVFQLVTISVSDVSFSNIQFSNIPVSKMPVSYQPHSLPKLESIAEVGSH